MCQPREAKWLCGISNLHPRPHKDRTTVPEIATMNQFSRDLPQSFATFSQHHRGTETVCLSGKNGMVKLQNRIFGFLSGHLAAFVRSTALVVLPMTAAAEMPEVQFSSTLSFDRGVQMTWDEGTMESSFAAAPSFLTTATAITTRPDGARLTYGASLDITGNGLATTNGANEVEAGLLLNYQRKFGTENAWQYQLRGEADRLLSENQYVFQRERLGFYLKYHHSPEHSTDGLVRFGYRDQNDDRFVGYDQTEFVGQLTHTWRPNNDRLAFAGTVYAEVRRAEEQRYSYDEIGTRLMARAPLSEEAEITARVSYYQREFLDSYENDDPTIREDTRLKAIVDFDYDFSESISGNLYAGWDQNLSTISETAYSGATVGIAITYQWR